MERLSGSVAFPCMSYMFVAVSAPRLTPVRFECMEIKKCILSSLILPKQAGFEGLKAWRLRVNRPRRHRSPWFFVKYPSVKFVTFLNFTSKSDNRSCTNAHTRTSHTVTAWVLLLRSGVLGANFASSGTFIYFIYILYHLPDIGWGKKPIHQDRINIGWGKTPVQQDRMGFSWNEKRP